jgi:hypothetical protein
VDGRRFGRNEPSGLKTFLRAQLLPAKTEIRWRQCWDNQNSHEHWTPKHPDWRTRYGTGLVADQNADVGKYQIERHNNGFEKQTTKNWQGKPNPSLRADLPVHAHERNILVRWKDKTYQKNERRNYTPVRVWHEVAGWAVENRTVAWTSSPWRQQRSCLEAAEPGHRNENKTPGSKSKIPCGRQQEALSREQSTKPFFRSNRTKLNWGKRSRAKQDAKIIFHWTPNTIYIWNT